MAIEDRTALTHCTCPVCGRASWVKNAPKNKKVPCCSACRETVAGGNGRGNSGMTFPGSGVPYMVKKDIRFWNEQQLMQTYRDAWE